MSVLHPGSAGGGDTALTDSVSEGVLAPRWWVFRHVWGPACRAYTVGLSTRDRYRSTPHDSESTPDCPPTVRPGSRLTELIGRVRDRDPSLGGLAFSNRSGALAGKEIAGVDKRYIALGVGAAVVGLAEWLRSAPAAPSPASSPEPGEYWFADVPFDDDPRQSKDRPILIVAVSTRHVWAHKVSSRDKSDKPARHGWIPVDTHTWDAAPRGGPSWLEVGSLRRIPRTGLRRRIGREADQRVLAELHVPWAVRLVVQADARREKWRHIRSERFG